MWCVQLFLGNHLGGLVDKLYLRRKNKWDEKLL